MRAPTRVPADRRQRQSGLTLIELAIAASVVTVLTVIAGARFIQQINDAAAMATGSYLLTIKSAMDAYLVANYERLSAPMGTVSVDDVALPLAPTLAEMRRAGLLQAGFPDRTPFGQRIAVRIERAGQCPGLSCRLDALIHTTTPLQLPGSIEPDIDLVAQVVMSSAGHGGASHIGAASTIRGATFAVANPLGPVVGVLGTFASLDTTMFNQFVRLRDSRDPDLQGSLTTQGAMISHHSLTVQDDAGNACIRAERTGVLSIRCAGQLNASTGLFTADRGDVVAINPETGVFTSQRVRAAAGVVTNRAVLFDSSDAMPTLRVSAGQMLVVTDHGLAVTVNGKDLIAHGNVSGARLGLRETVTLDQPCTRVIAGSAGDNVEFASTQGGGLAVCAAGIWRGLASMAVAGTVCRPNGALATDQLTGAGLVCRLGVWARVDDMLSSYVLVGTQLVNSGTVVAKPACGPLGDSAGTPLVYLIGQIESSKGSAFTRRAEDGGQFWRVHLLDYDGTPLAGPASAIAHVYCKY